MSALDYRKIQKVQCAGISISTFLSDDRSIILVSASDLVEGLAMNVVGLETMTGVEKYAAYDIIGRQETHYCIPHPLINEFLWMHDCNTKFENDLDDFRKYFSYEVMHFWNRFAPSAASLSVRDALKVMTYKSSEIVEGLDIPPGRIYENAFKNLGYETAPGRDNLTTEELSFVAYTEVLYTAMVARSRENGNTLIDAIDDVEDLLRQPMKVLGSITRSIGVL